MKQLFATLGVVLLLLTSCAEGELAGPEVPDAGASNPDAPMVGFPDASTSQPDARTFPDANTSLPDANTGGTPDAGLGICITDAECGANECCLLLFCVPDSVPGDGMCP